MKCDEVQDLLFEFITDDLSPVLTGEVRKHLGSGCGECSGVLAETEAVAAGLLSEVDQVSPPVAAAERLAARLEDVNAGRSTPSDFPMRLLAIAATALVAICGTWMVRSAFESDKTAEIARMQKEIGRRKDEIGALTRAFDASEDFAVALRSSDARMVSFAPADPKLKSAVGRAIWDREAGVLCLSVSGLPEAAQGQRHNVWLDNGQKPRRLTGFKVTPAGEAAIVVELGEERQAALESASLGVSLDSAADAVTTPGQVLLVGGLGSTVRIASNLQCSPDRQADCGRSELARRAMAACHDTRVSFVTLPVWTHSATKMLPSLSKHAS